MNEGDIVPSDSLVITELPEDLKGLDPIKDQEVFINTLVKKWNTIVEGVESQTIMFSKMVLEALRGQPDAIIQHIIEQIKKHPELRLTISKDRVWQGVRFVKSRPDIVDAPAISFEPTEMVYRKKDGTKNYEFYFELYKYNIPEGIRGILEVQGKGQGWSTRDLRQKIEEYRQEKMEPSQRVRFQKRDDIREMITLFKDMTSEGVGLCLTKVREIYGTHKHTETDRKDANAL